jgi:hypothetical protein
VNNVSETFPGGSTVEYKRRSVSDVTQGQLSAYLLYIIDGVNASNTA